MLDLKSKLLAAGLVTEEQVHKVEAEEEERRKKRREAREAREQARKGGGKPSGKRGEGKKGDGKRRGKGRPPGDRKPVADERADQERWQKRLEQLKAGGKSEQYEAIRAWVTRHRLDAVKAIPTEEAERFHFARHDEGIASLVLEPDVKAKVLDGSAGISAYMSNNGLAHCVLPRDVALDIAQLRPEWVRVLDGYDVVPNKDERRAQEYVADGEAQGEGASSEAGSPEAASSEAVSSEGETSEAASSEAVSTEAPPAESPAEAPRPEGE